MISWDLDRTLQMVESDPGAFTPARQDRHRDDHRSNATLLYCGNRVRQKRSRPTDGMVDVVCMLKHTSGAYTQRVPKHQGRVDQVCLGVWASMKAKASGRVDVYTQGQCGNVRVDIRRRSKKQHYCSSRKPHHPQRNTFGINKHRWKAHGSSTEGHDDHGETVRPRE